MADELNTTKAELGTIKTNLAKAQNQANQAPPPNAPNTPAWTTPVITPEVAPPRPAPAPDPANGSHVVYSNGDESWGKGSASGYMRYHWKNSQTYFGQFSNNQMHGFGIYIWPEDVSAGERYYAGYWENGKKEGQGTSYDSAGNLIYYGKFQDDQLAEKVPTDDKATCKFEKKDYYYDTYVGETKDGSPHGFGVFFYASGTIWIGLWIDGVRKDEGAYISPSGAVSTGK